MNPKKVWGTILIVLGVLLILGGANGFYEARVLENSLSSIDQIAMSSVLPQKLECTVEI